MIRRCGELLNTITRRNRVAWGSSLASASVIWPTVHMLNREFKRVPLRSTMPSHVLGQVSESPSVWRSIIRDELGLAHSRAPGWLQQGCLFPGFQCSPRLRSLD